MPIALAVHGGAWNIPDEAVAPALEGVRRALDAGFAALAGGASALDAVVETVGRLEDDPQFDAGVGSRLNRDGHVEMDASVMDGEGLRAGAVAAIRDVRHPVRVARLVMERSPHVLLVGDGARRFAEREGAELCATEDLLVGRERERYFRVRSGERELVDREFDPRGGEPPMGTVGAVARDRHGRVAAATSTGGTQDKLAGRVGDTPIPGAGSYADGDVGAASATGWGEGILRVGLTKTVIDLMAAGLDPHTAGRRALASLERIGAHGGLIVVSREGRVAAVFNTPRMARAVAVEGAPPWAAVEPGDDDGPGAPR